MMSQNQVSIIAAGQLQVLGHTNEAETAVSGPITCRPHAWVVCMACSCVSLHVQECWEGLVSEYDLAAAVESVDVTGVRLKSGNKCFSFPLSDT